MKLSAALAEAAARLAPVTGSPRLDAELLMSHALACPRTAFAAAPERELGGDECARIEPLLARRLQGWPVAYLMGEWEFWSLPLAVTPDVLIPRPETELLVEWALECLQGRGAPRVADLGTGSGAIALALKSERGDARILATDRSAAALAVARENARRLRLPLEFGEGDWCAALGQARFDLILSNPPYVRADDPHLQALRHEPRQALVGGASGLSDLERIAREAGTHLESGGWLLVEHGADQGAAVRDLLAQGGFQSVSTRRDLAGHERASGGRRGP